MPKSLEEIKAEFENKQFHMKERPKNKLRMVARILNMIFAVALIMMGACAIILFRGEVGLQTGRIYIFLNAKKEILFIVFAGLIILSFLLRFFTRNKRVI